MIGGPSLQEGGMLSLSVHLQSTYSSTSVHCSCTPNTRKCTPLLNSTAVATETDGKPPGPQESGGCRAYQGQGQRSEVAVGFPGSHRDVAALCRSGTAGSFRPLRTGLCTDCLRGCEPLYVSELLETGRGAPCRYPPASHEHGFRQPRESRSSIRSAETLIRAFAQLINHVRSEGRLYLHQLLNAGVPNAKLRFVYVSELRTSFPRDLARTSSDPLPSLQQDKNQVSRLRRSHRAIRLPDRQNNAST